MGEPDLPEGARDRTLRTAALSQVMILGRAVTMQVDRLTPTDHPISTTNALAVAFILAGALRGLLRAAEYALELGVGDAEREVVRRFLDAVPSAKPARDVLEHFDEYASGRGRDRHVEGFAPQVIYDGKGGVELVVPPYSIDLVQAGQAARELMGRLVLWGGRMELDHDAAAPPSAEAP
jgi:hypothetical protein